MRQCFVLQPAALASLYSLYTCSPRLRRPARPAQPPAKAYVILWFDTEDYVLPASDDAALQVADILPHRVPGNVQGGRRKARTLERRGRKR